MNSYYIKRIYVSGMPGTPLVDIDFEDTSVITGEQASGKSVLMRIMAGLYEYARIGDLKCLSSMLCYIDDDEWYGRTVTWFHLFDVAKIWLADGTNCELAAVDSKNGTYNLSINGSEPTQVKLPEVVYPKKYSLVFLDARRCARFDKIIGEILETDGFTMDFDEYTALCERILGKGNTPRLSRDIPVKGKNNGNKWKAMVESWIAFLGHGETELLLIYLLSRHPTVMLIDELHSGFHPLAQQRVARYVLDELAKIDVQVIYTTTSPFCMRDASDKVAELAYKAVINPEEPKAESGNAEQKGGA